MQLAQLSAEEREFLCGPEAGDDDFSAQLGARLAAVLSARLRRQVMVQPTMAANSLDPSPDPGLVWNDVLDEMWLCGRLGGRSSASSTPGATAPNIPHVSASNTSRVSALGARLRRTLQLALAETWLSQTAPHLPATLAFDVLAGERTARLDIAFPVTSRAMNQWAVHTIHHAE